MLCLNNILEQLEQKKNAVVHRRVGCPAKRKALCLVISIFFRDISQKTSELPNTGRQGPSKDEKQQKSN